MKARPTEMSEEMFAKFFDAAERAKMTKEERLGYLQDVMAYWDYHIVINESRERGLQEGMEKGRAEGKVEGLQEGMKKGIEKGREEGLSEGITQTAIFALKEGLDPAMVSKITGLPLERVLELQ